MALMEDSRVSAPLHDEATASGQAKAGSGPSLVVVSSVDKRAIGQVVLLDLLPVEIGRHHSADLSLNDEHVSRRHATVRRRGDEYELVDQRSQNGSFVNGCRWPLYRLQDGDSVRVGGTTLRFFNSRPRTRDSLAEGIAHELNNAVASLSGNVDFLAAAYRGGTLTREEFDEVMIDCSQSLARITDFVRRASGR